MNWLKYLLEANLYLSIFYVCYLLLLSRETFYSLNRLYLLSSCLVSFLLPLVQLSILKPATPNIQSTVFIVPINTGANNTPVNVAPISAPFKIEEFVSYAYLIGAAILFILFIIKIARLIRLAHTTPALAGKDYTLICVTASNTAFSFFNYLFIGAGVQDTDLIIRHELVHIRQKHSLDIIFLELFKVINWFNPFIFLLQNSLRILHEYIADKETTAADIDTVAYSGFLLNNAYGVCGPGIAHSIFSYNLLKKRIIMLHKKRSDSLARLKYLITLPICGGLLCMSTLCFSKTYGWFDLAPRKKPDTSVNHNQTFSDVKEYTNSKGYRIKIELTIINNKGSQKVTITDKAGTAHIFYGDSVTGPQRQAILQKYGFQSWLTGIQITKADKSLIPPPPPPAGPRNVNKPTPPKNVNQVLNTPPKHDHKKLLPPPPPPPAQIVLNDKDADKTKPKGRIIKTAVYLKPQASQNAPDSFYKQLARTTRYPTDAFKNDSAGRVILTFTVDVDNKVQDVTILRGPAQSINKEAARALKACDASGLSRGVKYIISVSFALIDKNGKYIAGQQAPANYTNGHKETNDQASNNEPVKQLNEVVIAGYK